MQQTQNEPRVIEHYRRLIAGFALLLVGVTWKLWTPQTLFPQIPLFAFAIEWPAIVDYIAVVFIFVGGFVLLLTNDNKSSRIASLLLLFGFSISLVLDQHRLQPWAWQFFLAILLLLIVPQIHQLRSMQLLAICVYFFSSISKFDINFLEGSAQILLTGLLQSVGISIEQFSESLRFKMAFMFPVGELLVAILLFIPKTRFIGFIASIFLHLSLLMTLGPLGLNHSWGVLCWNLFFIGQNIILFRNRSPELEKIKLNIRIVVTYLILLLPVLEWFGCWDHWPSWTVYSERTEKVHVYVSRNSIPLLSRKILIYLENSEFDNEWKKVNMDRWSIETLGVPQYPQLRVELANALALKDRFRLTHSDSEDSKIKIFVEPVASRWTSTKDMRAQTMMPSKEFQVEYDPAKCEEFFERTFWNHHPRALWLTQNR